MDKRIIEVLQAVVDHDGGVAYAHGEDEVGHYTCCLEVSYKPHKKDCFVTKARELLDELKKVGVPSESENSGITRNEMIEVIARRHGCPKKMESICPVRKTGENCMFIQTARQCWWNNVTDEEVKEAYDRWVKEGESTKTDPAFTISDPRLV